MTADNLESLTAAQLGEVATVRLAPFPQAPSYLVSNDGRVYGPRQGEPREGARPEYMLLKTHDRAGYEAVGVYLPDGTRRDCSVHCMVLETFTGPRPEGHQGAHRDGNRWNNRLSNLRWATPKENASDKLIHGTALIGDANPNAKVHLVDLNRLWACVESGMTYADVGRIVGLHRTTVQRVVTGKSWKKHSALIRAARAQKASAK